MFLPRLSRPSAYDNSNRPPLPVNHNKLIEDLKRDGVSISPAAEVTGTRTTSSRDYSTVVGQQSTYTTVYMGDAASGTQASGLTAAERARSLDEAGNTQEAAVLYKVCTLCFYIVTFVHLYGSATGKLLFHVGLHTE